MSQYIQTGMGPIFVDTIVCKGNEDNLTSCTQLLDRNLHNCVHPEDVHLFCSITELLIGNLKHDMV